MQAWHENFVVQRKNFMIILLQRFNDNWQVDSVCAQCLVPNVLRQREGTALPSFLSYHLEHLKDDESHKEIKAAAAAMFAAGSETVRDLHFGHQFDSLSS